MILVVGEALVDVVERSDGSRTEHAGGSPMNVAVGLGRLGLDVTLATAIGDDAYGALIESHLATRGRHPGRRLTRVWADVCPPSPTSPPDGSATYDFELTWDPGLIPVPDGVNAVHTGSIAATPSHSGRRRRRDAAAGARSIGDRLGRPQHPAGAPARPRRRARGASTDWSASPTS